VAFRYLGFARLVRLGVVLACVMAFAAPAEAAFAGANGKIAFDSLRGVNPQCSIPNCNFDIYAMNPDGSGMTQLTTNPAYDREPAWSADGTKIAFVSSRDDPNPGGCSPCIREIYVMNADGTGQTRVTTDSLVDENPSWSPDGQKIVFQRTDTDCFQGGDLTVHVVNADGTGETEIANGASPGWSPDGQKILVYSPCTNSMFTVNPDGSHPGPLPVSAPFGFGAPSWAPDGMTLAYSKASGTGSALYLRAGNGTEFPLTSDGLNGEEPAWSPDGTKIAFQRGSEIYSMNADGSGVSNLTNDGEYSNFPSWQPLPQPSLPGYPRPKAATPIVAALVPAYKQCTSPNHTHGPPLSFPSCSPPTPASQYLTVGTADSNGQPTKFIGSVKLTSQPGNAATLQSEADLLVHADMTDVRCKVNSNICTSPLSDYAGHLTVTMKARLTDRWSGESSPQPSNASLSYGTVDFPFDLSQAPRESPISFDVPCGVTGDTTVGSTCSFNTSMNALAPDMVKEGKRAVWEIGQVHVYDGGEDGVTAEGDGTLFAVQGVFVP
jgi:Tol biopolymer transport system component